MGLFDQALAAEGASGKFSALARSIFQQESSSGSNTATSNAGAHGAMQILPGTFAEVADKGWDINNPEHNMRAGIRYLAKMDKLGGGDPVLAAAGYYGGPGGLDKARKGIAVSDPRNPNAPNTLQYGEQVAARMGGKKTMARAPVEPELPMSIPAGAEQLQANMQVPPQVVAQQAPVPVPLLASGEPDSWQRFNQAIQPQQVMQEQAPVMQYGPADQMNRQFQLASINTQPDFRRFGAWGVKV